MKTEVKPAPLESPVPCYYRPAFGTVLRDLSAWTIRCRRRCTWKVGPMLSNGW